MSEQEDLADRKTTFGTNADKAEEIGEKFLKHLLYKTTGPAEAMSAMSIAVSWLFDHAPSDYRWEFIKMMSKVAAHLDELERQEEAEAVVQ